MATDDDLLAALDDGTASEEAVMVWEVEHFGTMMDNMRPCIELPEGIPESEQERTELTRALVFLSVTQHYLQLKRALDELRDTAS